MMIDKDRDSRGAMERPIVKKRDEYKKIMAVQSSKPPLNISINDAYMIPD